MVCLKSWNCTPKMVFLKGKMRRKHFLFWLLSFQTDPDVHPVVPKWVTIWQANDVPDVIAQGLWTSYWLGCTSKFNPELMVILMVKQGKMMMNPGILLIGTSLVRILEKIGPKWLFLIRHAIKPPSNSDDHLAVFRQIFCRCAGAEHATDMRLHVSDPDDDQPSGNQKHQGDFP